VNQRSTGQASTAMAVKSTYNSRWGSRIFVSPGALLPGDGSGSHGGANPSFHGRGQAHREQDTLGSRKTAGVGGVLNPEHGTIPTVYNNVFHPTVVQQRISFKI
jgi:hypothetical protein